MTSTLLEILEDEKDEHTIAIEDENDEYTAIAEDKK